MTDKRRHNIHGKQSDGITTLTLDGLYLPNIPSGSTLGILDQYGTVGPSLTPAPPATYQKLYVHASHVDVVPHFSNVGNAITYLNTLTLSPTNAWGIEVLPGVVLETQTLVLPDYSTLFGVDERTCIVRLNTNLGATPFLTMNTQDINVHRVTLDGNFNTDVVIQIATGPGGLVHWFRDVTLQFGVVHQLEVVGPNLVFAANCSFFSTGGVGTACVSIRTQASYGCNENLVQNVNFDNTGVGVEFIDSFSANVLFRNQVGASAALGFDVSYDIDNSNVIIGPGGDCSLSSTSISAMNGSSVYCNNVRANALVTDIFCDATSNIFTLGMLIDPTKLAIDPAAIYGINYVEENENFTEGLTTLGNAVFGSTAYPSNVYIGEGAAFTVGLELQGDSLVFPGTWTNYNTLLEKSNTTPRAMFSGSSFRFYVGSDQPCTTLLASIATLDASLSGVEVYSGFHAAYVSVGFMTSSFDAPFESTANSMWETTGVKEIRISQEVYNPVFDWQTTVENGIEKYWIRLRIPLSLELFWVVPFFNTTRINSLGIRLLYGEARTLRQTPFDWSAIQRRTPNLNDPDNVDVYPATNLVFARRNNAFTLNDVASFSLWVPPDMDTSSPVIFRVAYCTFDATPLPALQTSFTIRTGILEPDKVLSATSGGSSGSLLDAQTFTHDFEYTTGEEKWMKTTDIFISFPMLRVRTSTGINPSQIFIQLTCDDAAPQMVLVNATVYYLSCMDGSCTFYDGIL